MKKFALLPLVLVVLSTSVALGDDQVRNVQTELKGQGFYYGEVDGKATAETTSAIRRYQIRNGLEVTGTLNKETMSALGLQPKTAPAVASKPASAPAVSQPTPAPVTVAKKPPVNLRREETVEESDRNFLRREEARDQSSQPPPAPQPPQNDYRPAPAPVTRERQAAPEVVNPPAPLEAPSADFPVLFANTPFANAPAEVQQQTLRNAQSILADRGFYRDVVDGLPGPATEEALLTYQRSARLTLTGRLDIETLSQLRLLPGRSSYPDVSRYHAAPRVYRGYWLDR